MPADGLARATPESAVGGTEGPALGPRWRLPVAVTLQRLSFDGGNNEARTVEGPGSGSLRAMSCRANLEATFRNPGRQVRQALERAHC